LTKSEIENLEERVNRITPSIEPEASGEMEKQALWAWISIHMTEAEEHEYVTLWIRFKDNEPKRPNETEWNSYKALISTAIERTKNETEPDWLEWRDKWIRAETIRHGQRLMTETEHNELNELNIWFDDRRQFNPTTGKVGPWTVR
jgi:hypothetical protein